MTELFFESPVTLGVLGAVLAIMALVVWIKGGFSAALYTALGLILLTIALVLLSIRVQTDREAITTVLDDVAAAVQRNDLPAVLVHILPSAATSVRQAKTEFPNYHFTEARITGIKGIEVDRSRQSAIAEFYVAISLDANGNQVDGVRRFVRTYFVKHDGRWLVNNYEHFSVEQSLKGDASVLR